MTYLSLFGKPLALFQLGTKVTLLQASLSVNLGIIYRGAVRDV